MSRYSADFMADYLSVPPRQITSCRPASNSRGIRNARCRTPRLPTGRLRLAFWPGSVRTKDCTCWSKRWSFWQKTRRCRPTGLRRQLLGPCRPRVSCRFYQRLQSSGLADRFEYIGEVDRDAKIAFLQSLDLFCLPTVVSESKRACPCWRLGQRRSRRCCRPRARFPELMQDTGGGILYEPARKEALATALKRMICNRDFALTCGRQAHRLSTTHLGRNHGPAHDGDLSPGNIDCLMPYNINKAHKTIILDYKSKKNSSLILHPSSFPPFPPCPRACQRPRKRVSHPGGTVGGLRGVSFELGDGGESGDPRAERLRQEHAVEHPRGLLERRTRGRGLLDGEDPHALDERGAAAFRNRAVGFVFQEHYLLPQCSVLENVLIPQGGGRTDCGRNRRSGPGCWTASV